MKLNLIQPKSIKHYLIFAFICAALNRGLWSVMSTAPELSTVYTAAAFYFALGLTVLYAQGFYALNLKDRGHSVGFGVMVLILIVSVIGFGDFLSQVLALWNR